MRAEKIVDTARPSRRWSKICYRSKTTNDPLDLPMVDARTVWGRRRRDLIRVLCAEVARRGRKLTPPQQLLVNQCASLQTRLEQVQAQVCHGDTIIDDEQLTRLGASIARLLDRLGLANHELAPPMDDVDPMLMHRKGDP